MLQWSELTWASTVFTSIGMTAQGRQCGGWKVSKTQRRRIQIDNGETLWRKLAQTGYFDDRNVLFSQTNPFVFISRTGLALVIIRA
jgi:hypothetical protein